MFVDASYQLAHIDSYSLIFANAFIKCLFVLAHRALPSPFPIHSFILFGVFMFLGPRVYVSVCVFVFLYNL